MTREPTRDEWLAVPVEVLRRHFRDRADRSSVRAVAEALDVGRTTLHTFLAGESAPHMRTRRLLAIAYLKETRGDWRDEIDTAEAALTIMARLCPGDQHAARLDFFAAMMDLFGAAQPPWIDDLRARIEGPLPPRV
jgi:hypothetical protein